MHTLTATSTKKYPVCKIVHFEKNDFFRRYFRENVSILEIIYRKFQEIFNFFPLMYALCALLPIIID